MMWQNQSKYALSNQDVPSAFLKRNVHHYLFYVAFEKTANLKTIEHQSNRAGHCPLGACIFVLTLFA